MINLVWPSCKDKLAYIVYQDSVVLVLRANYRSMSEEQLTSDTCGHDASETHGCHISMSYGYIGLTSECQGYSSGLGSELHEADQDP